jgi:hypothetical protein
VLCAIDAVGSTRRQRTNVGAILAGSVIALLQRAHWAQWIAGSAGVVLPVVSVVLAFRLQDRHDRVIDFMLDGHEDAGPPIVQRKRDRLLSARNRSQRARSVAAVACEATTLRRRSLRVTPALFARRIVAPVAEELMEISGLRNARATSAQAVARADRLLGFATSPLYGDDVAALRDEVNALRDLLARSPARDPRHGLPTVTR